MIDPLRAFTPGPPADSAERQGVYLREFRLNLGLGHWNEVGHVAAGKKIAAQDVPPSRQGLDVQVNVVLRRNDGGAANGPGEFEARPSASGRSP